MNCNEHLHIDRDALLHSLGGRAQPGGVVQATLEQAARAVEQAATPRWVSARFALEAGTRLAGAGLSLSGECIREHLAGCDACMVLAVTLGSGVDALLRSAGPVDVALAVAMDAAASQLVEVCAGWATRQLENRLAAGRYMTQRFSPGYGDLPLGLQKSLVELLDAPRAIGLGVTDSGLLVPRKSITALLGEAGRPVTGKQAGCRECALRDRCTQKKEDTEWHGM